MGMSDFGKKYRQFMKQRRKQAEDVAQHMLGASEQNSYVEEQINKIMQKDSAYQNQESLSI